MATSISGFFRHLIQPSHVPRFINVTSHLLMPSPMLCQLQQEPEACAKICQPCKLHSHNCPSSILMYTAKFCTPDCLQMRHHSCFCNQQISRIQDFSLPITCKGKFWCTLSFSKFDLRKLKGYTVSYQPYKPT